VAGIERNHWPDWSVIRICPFRLRSCRQLISSIICLYIHNKRKEANNERRKKEANYGFWNPCG
jgi:hypothetical protein